jgi:hypothetical protein
MPNHHAHAFAGFTQGQAGIGQGTGTHFEGQQLLGQDIVDFVGWNLELTDAHRKAVDIGPFGIKPVEGTDNFRVRPFPAAGRAIVDGAVTLKYSFFKRFKIVKRSQGHIHPTMATGTGGSSPGRSWTVMDVARMGSGMMPAGGHASNRIWALMPPKPKALTAARRKWFEAIFQGAAWVCTLKGLPQADCFRGLFQN